MDPPEFVIHPTGSACPSCGRFVGPLEQCPHCGASIKKRLPMRYLRLFAVLIAIVGLGILWYAATGAATSSVKIASIQATMNYAYVQISGVVTRGPHYNPDTQELSFYLADDTGEIPVFSFRSTTPDLITAQKIPVAGDHINVKGTLRIRDDFSSLNLSSADQLEINRPPPQSIAIGEIGADDNLRVVSIKGDVRDIKIPYKGLSLISVGDATGEIDVAISPDLVALGGSLPTVQPGDSVQVNGTIIFFKGTPQVQLNRMSDMVKLDDENAPVTTSNISSIDGSRVGTRVQVAGEVTAVNGFSEGRRIILNDGTGEITVLLWLNTLEQIPNLDALGKGARLQAVGKVNQYHGDLEVVPEHASDLQIVPTDVIARDSGAPTPIASDSQVAKAESTRTATPPALERTIGSLSEGDKDNFIRVDGRITKVISFSQGMQYTLDDGTGTIKLVLFSDALRNIKERDAFLEGARVEAKGKVNVFNGALEIIPTKAADVALIQVSNLPTPAHRSIASLNTNDLGKTVIVNGKVTRLEDFSKGKYVFVSDGTDELRVVLFSNVLESIPNAIILSAGSNITVRGELNLFKGELELVPDPGGVASQ